MAEVEGHKVQEVFKETFSSSDIGWNKRQGQWMMVLFNGIAKYNFCQIVLTNTGRDIKIHVMGEPQNIEVVVYLGAQLSTRLLNMEKRAWNPYQGQDKKGTFRRGYLMGASMGIISKLREQREAASRASASVTALVLVQSEKVALFVEQEFPSLGKSRASKTKSSAIYQGYRDGKAMDIYKGMNSPESHKNLE